MCLFFNSNGAKETTLVSQPRGRLKSRDCVEAVTLAQVSVLRSPFSAGIRFSVSCFNVALAFKGVVGAACSMAAASSFLCAFSKFWLKPPTLARCQQSSEPSVRFALRIVKST